MPSSAGWYETTSADAQPGALLILAMIGGVVATELLAAGLRGRRVRRPARALCGRRPGGPARVARPVGDAGRFALLWWAHIALVAAFLVYLPFSKHLHIATSFLNIYFRKLAPRGELPAMDLEDETRRSA